ncbi:MAG: hypothetical protein F6K10_15605 [Moorea sp. SIO2B7]|nr:hypothetical protein [Moorena sp. SIO2B7]
MSPQPTKSNFKISTSVLKRISFPLSILLLFSSGRAIALPNAENDLLNSITGELLQVIGDSEKYPPEVIISDSSSSEDESTAKEPSLEESEPPEVVVESEPEETESTTPTTTKPRFTCQLINGEYTVMYHPESQPEQGYPWAIPSQMGGGWTPDKRCYEISRRLEFYRPDGLQELSTSVINNYDIVCVTTEKDPNCRIVFTVPPGQDPYSTRDRVFENLTVADSGQQTQGVNTFVSREGDRQILSQVDQIIGVDLSTIKIGGNRSGSTRRSRYNSINLRPFLDPADGGTGKLLRGSRSIPSNSRRLNPENFR